MVFLEHLHVRVLREAILTHGGKVGSFPSGAVDILFDLWGGHVVWWWKEENDASTSCCCGGVWLNG